jgi:hypothetical protein
MTHQPLGEGENQTPVEDYGELTAPELTPELQPEDAEIPEGTEPTWFHAQFTDCMELYAGLETVAEHFADHHSWFRRCAQPMKAEPLGENGYDLLIGRFGAFGYKVEARIGLDLLPPDAEDVYRILTIPVPEYEPPGYEVDFRATMKLVEKPVEEFCSEAEVNNLGLPNTITGAEWHLDLAVGVKFPRFITKMSQSLIQKTGDNLLDKIVKQVSRRLTYKTQLDFHTTHELPFPGQKKGKKGDKGTMTD